MSTYKYKSKTFLRTVCKFRFLTLRKKLCLVKGYKKVNIVPPKLITFSSFPFKKEHELSHCEFKCK